MWSRRAQGRTDVRSRALLVLLHLTPEQAEKFLHSQTIRLHLFKLASVVRDCGDREPLASFHLVERSGENVARPLENFQDVLQRSKELGIGRVGGRHTFSHERTSQLLFPKAFDVGTTSRRLLYSP